MQATMERTEQRFGNASALNATMRPRLQPAPRDALDLLEQFRNST